MKCRAIKKMLPLYAGEDLPLFKRSVARHLQKCEKCHQEHQKYVSVRVNLETLQHTSVPSRFMEGYWEELSAKLEEPQSEISPPVPTMVNPWWTPFKSSFAFAVLFVIYVALSTINQINTSQNTDGNIAGETKPNQAIISPALPPWMFDKKKVESPYTPYELDEVHPVVTKVSF